MAFENNAMLWLLLLAPLLLLVLRFSLAGVSGAQLALSALVRCVVLLLLVAALAGALNVGQSTRLAVLVLADRSASVPDNALAQSRDFFAELGEAVPPGSVIGLGQFAAEATLAVPLAESPELPEELGAPEDTGSTDLAAALQLAQETMPADYVRRVVILSDGNDTEGNDAAIRAARICAAQGIQVYTAAYEAEERPEVLLTTLEAPPELKPGQSFAVRAVAMATAACEAEFSLFRNGFKVQTQSLALEAGANELVFEERDPPDGLLRYTLRVAAQDDFYADNNVASAIVSVTGETRVLLLEGDEREGRFLARALGAEGIRVEVRGARGMPGTLSELAAYDAVLFSDVPATEVSAPQMRMLRSYVEDLGGGFVMMGGEDSFGLGGYFRTEVEALLPVRMKSEKQKQNPSLALMIILDKSGSMGGVKIQMAREAALKAVDLMQSQDYVGLVSFDSQPYTVVELQQARNKLGIMQTIETLMSGGGTSIYPAMEMGFEALESVPAVYKHIVLLTDGQSQAGDYEGIVARMTGARITVSTVAVGEGADVRLLEDIARWGDGRFYFTADPYDIPQIFTKETMTASKSSLIEEPFLPQLFQPLPVVRGVDWEAAPFLFGYVVTTPKPTAETGLVTEQGDPLYVTWRFGLGKSAAFASDAKSRWAADWLSWPGYGAFWAQVVRDVMRTSSSRGAECRIELEGGVGRLVVDTTNAEGNFVNGLDTRAQSVAPDLSVSELTLEQRAPGRYEATFSAVETGSYLFKIRQTEQGGGGQVVSDFTRAITLSYNPEYRHLGTNREFLAALADAGGTAYPVGAGAIAQVSEAEAVAIYRPLWPWLVGVALFLFIADVALRRLEVAGWRFGGAPRRYG